MSELTEQLKLVLNSDSGRLDKAALLVARLEYPDLHLEEYICRLDEIAESIAAKGCDAAEPFLAVNQINQELFEVRGFKGNSKEYYDPRNSFLNDVLIRNTGIPISLSLVYMEIGRRLGLSIEGVGNPGHFIVRYVHSSGGILIDPFNGGRMLTREHCRKHVQKSNLVFEERFLDPIGPVDLITRMLRNLKAIYVHNDDFSRALRVTETMVGLGAAQPAEMRDLGVLYLHNAKAGPAIAVLEEYLKLASDANDIEVVEEQIALAWKMMARAN